MVDVEAREDEVRSVTLQALRGACNHWTTEADLLVFAQTLATFGLAMMRGMMPSASVQGFLSAAATDNTSIKPERVH